MKHNFSTELFRYYRCGACQQWWGIEDGPTEGTLYCPRCGVRAELEAASEQPPSGPPAQSLAEIAENSAIYRAMLHPKSSMGRPRF